MIAKLKLFYTKHRTLILRINDFVPIVFGYTFYLIPDGELKTLLLVVFTAIYGGNLSRYYLPKK